MSEARPIVLDSSAVLTLLQRETGWEEVANVLAGARISAVNLSEVTAKLLERGLDIASVHAAIRELGLKVDPFGATDARAAGALRVATRFAGLSLGDRACVALAIRRGATCYTADQAWHRLALPGLFLVVIR